MKGDSLGRCVDDAKQSGPATSIAKASWMYSPTIVRHLICWPFAQASRQSASPDVIRSLWCIRTASTGRQASPGRFLATAARLCARIDRRDTHQSGGLRAAGRSAFGDSRNADTCEDRNFIASITCASAVD